MAEAGWPQGWSGGAAGLEPALRGSAPSVLPLDDASPSVVVRRSTALAAKPSSPAPEPRVTQSLCPGVGPVGSPLPAVVTSGAE